MDIQPVVPFSPGSDDEPLRQTHGHVEAPERIYAAVRPRGAALIAGAALADPANAILVTWNGHVVFLRPDGAVDLEKIPGVGDAFETDEEGSYGIAGAAVVSGGALFVAASEARICKRVGPGSWELLTADLAVDPDAPREEAVFLDCITASETGALLAVGRRDFDAVICERNADGGWERALPDGGGLLSATIARGGEAWACGNGGGILRRAGEGGWARIRSGLPQETFLSIMSWADRLFVSQAVGPIFEIREGALADAPQIPGDAPLVSARFFMSGGALMACGDNGFARFDGEAWARLPSPW